MKHAKTLILIALCLVLLACTTSQLVTTLDAISTAAAVAVPIIFAAGSFDLDSDTQTAIVQYLQAVNTAVIQTGTELQSSDTTAMKALKITEYFAAATWPNLPADTPVAVTQVLKAVAVAIESLVASLTNAKVSMHLKRSPVPVRLSTHEKQVLLHAMSTASSSLITLSAK